MKKEARVALFNLVLIFGLILMSIINMVDDSFDWTSIGIFSCVIIIFLSNLTSYLKQNKNNKSGK